MKPRLKEHTISYLWYYFVAYVESIPLDSRKTKLLKLKLLIFLSTTNSFNKLFQKSRNNDIIFIEKSKKLQYYFSISI